MKVEFKNLQDKLEVIEHTIRKTTAPDVEYTSQAQEHLQARLLLKKFDDQFINFSIAYYSADNEFLGLDNSGEIYISKSKDKSVAISTPIDAPENTDRAIVRFIFEEEANSDSSFYELAAKIGLAIFIAWLGLSLFKSFVSFFK